MKNLFSAKLYWQGLRKLRVAGIAMAVVIIVMNAWFPLECIINQSPGFRPDFADYHPIISIDETTFAPLGIAVMLFAPLLVYHMFSYLNERKASDFYHALPQKRRCVYISFTSAVLTWIVAVLCATSIVNTILWTFVPDCELSFRVIAVTFVGFLTLALVTAGFMALAMTLTGTAVANVLVFILFSLFIRACGIFFFYGFSQVTPMFDPTNSWLKFFDADFFLPIGLIVRFLDGKGNAGEYENTWFLLYWFTVGIALLALSCVTYCRRRSESATKSAPNRIMQNIYRIGVTFPFLMTGAYILLADGDFYLCLIPMLAALLVWILFELLTTKKLQNVIRSLPVLLIPAVLTGGYVASVYLARNVFYASTPEREEIASARLERAEDTLTGWEHTLLATVEITEAEVLDYVYHAIEQTKTYDLMSWQEKKDSGLALAARYSEMVTLTLNSGKKVTYHLCSPYVLYDIFKNSAQIHEILLSGPDFEIQSVRMQFGAEADRRIWEAIKEDFDALSDEQKSAYLQYAQNDKVNAPHLTVYGVYGGQRFFDHFNLHLEYTPNAYRLYAQFDIGDRLPELRDAADRIAELRQEDVTHAYMLADDVYGYTWQIKTENFRVIREFLQKLAIDSHLADCEKIDKGEIYRFVLQIDTKDEKNGIYLQIELTLSREDFATYREVVSNAGAMPIS
ncbi:MAG: hypothetical protein IKM00_05315 [Clostridia bacterium]|nr:hypothetical protein [Clostridia bacterium]